MIAQRKTHKEYKDYETFKKDGDISPNIIKFIDGFNLSNRDIDWQFLNVHSLYAPKDGAIFRINETVRTFENQRKAHKDGASKVDIGYHNFGLAVDLFMTNFGDMSGRSNFDIKKKVRTTAPADGKTIFTCEQLYNRIGVLRWAKKCGLSWGGYWEEFYDPNHFEDHSYKLPSKETKTVGLRALNEKTEDDDKKSFFFDCPVCHSRFVLA